MPEPERRQLPALLLIILALFGITTFQKGSDSGSEAKSKAEATTAATRARAPERPSDAARTGDERILRPLLEHYEASASRATTLEEVAALTEGTGKDELKCLIVLLPDPVRSTNSYRFDEFLAAVQRGLESQQYVFDGYRFPWSEEPAKDGPGAGGAPDAKGAAPATDQPGAVLFRSKKDDKGVSRLLLALVVPETPTRGVEKGVLLKSLELARWWDSRNRAALRVADHGWSVPSITFNILGPIFSGTQPSLEQALASYAHAPGCQDLYRFDLITGSATEIKRDQLRKSAVGGTKHKLTFSATVHRSDALRETILSYVNQSNPIALLVESNTGFGASVQPGDPAATKAVRPSGQQAGPAAPPDDRDAAAPASGRPFYKPIYYPFPLHISRLRSKYDQKGVFRDRGPQQLRSAERLKISTEDAASSRDIIESQTPEVTTAIEELTLNQILTDIARRQIRTVGIMATDPLDVVFLAREVRQFSSDVQLFTTQANLIYSHPDFVSDLRGMLVASAYPLFANNQSWTYSYRGDMTHYFFASDNAQGTYNATVAQMLAMKANTRGLPPRFLEYGLPFAPPGQYGTPPGGTKLGWQDVRRKPPIWISVVGQRGLYPVRVYATPPSVPGRAANPQGEDETYVYPRDQAESEYLSLGLSPPGSVAAAVERGQGELIRNWFRPTLVFLWCFVFAGVSVVCLTVASIAALHLSWLVRRPNAEDRGAFWFGFMDLRQLAQFLNCCPPGGSEVDLSLRGPGPYPFLAVLLMTAIYLTITLPLFGLLRINWIGTARATLEFGCIVVAYVVVVLLLAGLAMALTAMAETWQRRPRRRRADGARGGAVTRSRAVLDLACIIWLVLLIGGLLALNVRAGRWDASLRSFGALGDRERWSLLDFERMMAVSSGISPMFPMLFLGAAGLAWIYAQLKRRHVFDQCTFDSPAAAASNGADAGDAEAGGAQHARNAPETRSVDRQTLLDIRSRRAAFEHALNHPFRLLWKMNVAYTLPHVAFVTYFLFPVVNRLWHVAWATTQIQENPLFESVTWVLVLVLFFLLTLHTFQLVVVWSEMHGIMELVMRLPLVAALERMPSRVGRWFFETPSGGTSRSELIRRQANALAERTSPAVMERLNAIAPGSVPSAADWDALRATLRDGGSDLVPTVRRTLVPLLEAYWSSLPVESAFGEAAREAGAVSAKPQPAAREKPQPRARKKLRPWARKEVVQPAAQETDPLPGWLRQAEDLVALLFVRWLAASLSQIWILITFLVVGSLSLLLAISSYPFLLQGHLMLGLGLLIAFLTVIVFLIVIALSRNEVISRISNTPPNKIDFDGRLLSNVVTYIGPLLGVLAAISFDVSDVIRTVLDPILRFMR